MMNNCLVRPYAAPDWTNLAPLLAAGSFNPESCTTNERVPEDHLVCKHLTETQGNEGGAWVVAQQNHLRAFGCFRKLPWDSKQLRMSAARIDYLLAGGSYQEQRAAKEMLLEELLMEAQSLGVWHMSVRVDASDLSSLHVLEEAGFITVDGILTFVLDLNEHPAVAAAGDFKIRQATADDAPEAAELARTVYVFDRFHADPFIDRELADELHANWVRNSCEGQSTEAMLIAEDQSGLLGFVTCKLPGDDGHRTNNSRTGSIVLVAAATHARGRSVGRGLTMAALEWFRSNGCESVEVGTQLSNIPASRLYQTCGFRLRATSVSLRRLL
jgi:dTDP-4-amino-4,6-dideoxy-D-galactose acyltransferase